MGKPKQYIEPVKNLILVVLFFTTMLLLYFFWGNPVLNSFKISDLIGDEAVEVPSYQSVTQPGRIVVHLGGGSYTVLEEEDFNAWQKYIELLQGLNPAEVLSVEEITAEQFDKIMEFRSIVYRFYYDLPQEAFLKRYSIKDIHGIDQIGEFSNFGFSSGSPESLFIYDGSKNKYYRIVSAKAHEEMDKLLSLVESSSNANYRRIGDLTGTANRTVIPIFLSTNMSELKCFPEFEDLNTIAVKEFAQTFFGESLDFVRQIHGSKGTHIYMYGYGEKVLTISASGKVEYKNKETSQSSQQSYFEALDTALQFVAAHGGWQTEEGMEMSPYVRFANAVENNKQKGYRIIFGMRLRPESLYLESSHSVMVEVIHGQVTQYLRDMVYVEEPEYLKQEVTAKREAFSVINMIAHNYTYIASVLSESGYDFSGLEGEALFDAVSDLVVFVKAGYVKPEYAENKENVLFPAWIVNTGSTLIYFDLYSAEPLGHKDLWEE